MKTFSIKLDAVKLAQFEETRKKYRYRDLQDFINQMIEQQYSNSK